MIYEICYSNSLTINKSNYENEKPFYSQKIVIDTDQPVDVKAEYSKLRTVIDELVIAQYNASKLDQSGLRVRVKDGKKYVSVTSILGGGKKYDGDPEYGLRGTEIHRLVNQYAQTGEWENPTVKLAKLTFEDCKYKEFFEANKSRIDFGMFECELEVFNDEHLYSGEVDIICDVDGIITLADIKTGASWKWEQLVAYYKALHRKDVKQLAVFDLKKQKLETLALKDGIPYWEQFLRKRGAVEAIYGV
jgi:hypothetical protein